MSLASRQLRRLDLLVLSQAVFPDFLFDLDHAQLSLSAALVILLAAAVDRHDDESHQDDTHDENDRYEHDCVIALSSVALVFAVGGIQYSQVHF